MNLLKKNYLVQLQCYLWIGLMAFATIGCSAKQTLFEALDFTVEKPLTGSKALVNIGNSNCTVITSSEEVRETVSKQIKEAETILLYSALLKNNVILKEVKNIEEDYILQLAGTDPPLYLMFQQIKLALL